MVFYRTQYIALIQDKNYLATQDLKTYAHAQGFDLHKVCVNIWQFNLSKNSPWISTGHQRVSCLLIRVIMGAGSPPEADWSSRWRVLKCVHYSNGSSTVLKVTVVIWSVAYLLMFAISVAYCIPIKYKCHIFWPKVVCIPSTAVF